MFCGTVSVCACWLGVCTEGCQLSTCRIVYISDPAFSEPIQLCVYGVLGTANSVLGHCSWTTVALPVTV